MSNADRESSGAPVTAYGVGVALERLYDAAWRYCVGLATWQVVEGTFLSFRDETRNVLRPDARDEIQEQLETAFSEFRTGLSLESWADQHNDFLTILRGPGDSDRPLGELCGTMLLPAADLLKTLEQFVRDQLTSEQQQAMLFGRAVERARWWARLEVQIHSESEALREAQRAATAENPLARFGNDFPVSRLDEVATQCRQYVAEIHSFNDLSADIRQRSRELPSGPAELATLADELANVRDCEEVVRLCATMDEVFTVACVPTDGEQITPGYLGLVADRANNCVGRFGRELEIVLQQMEMNVFIRMLQTGDRLCSNDNLEAAWDGDYPGGPASIDTVISTLRGKLRPLDVGIETRRRVGRRLIDVSAEVDQPHEA